MAIKEQEVMVPLIKHVNHFELLGYPIPRTKDKNGREIIKNGEKIKVKIEDLPNDSSVMVTKICDLCGREIKNQYYSTIVKSRENNFTGLDQCRSCARTRKINMDIKMKGSLQINFPLLAKEWHTTKNQKSADEYLAKSSVKVWWICSKCGKEFVARIDRRSVNGGCVECNSSKGESEIFKYLNSRKINYESQCIFNELIGVGGKHLRFDFGIYNEMHELIFIIEFDGIHHFEKVYDNDDYESLIINDQLKNGYCKINNIPLIRIPFWDIGKISFIVDNYCGYYSLLNKNYNTNVIEKYLVNSNNYISPQNHYLLHIKEQLSKRSFKSDFII